MATIHGVPPDWDLAWRTTTPAQDWRLDWDRDVTVGSAVIGSTLESNQPNAIAAETTKSEHAENRGTLRNPLVYPET
jgi:hypothetical protein